MHKTFNGGVIEVICGPMFASKTETLISRYTRFQYANKSIKVFKPSIDNRYSEENIVSHSGYTINSVPVKESKEIREFLMGSQDVDVVFIDEVQFFDDGIVQVIEDLAESGVYVVAAGLDQDFKGKPFPIVANLMAVAEIVTKLTAVCPICGAAATKSQRLVNGKPADWSEDVVQVGASDSYEARCREHHYINKENS